MSFHHSRSRAGQHLGAALVPVLLAWVLQAIPSASAGASEAPNGSARSGPAFDSQVEQVVNQLLSDLPEARRAHVKSLELEGIAWEAADDSLVGTSRLGLSMKQAVSGALSRQGITATPAVGLGSKGVGGAILRGSFRMLKSGAQLSLLLVDASSGQVLSKAQRIMSTTGMTGMIGEDGLPPNAANARILANLVRQTLSGAPSAFGLRITTDRGAQAAYTEGETLHALVQADRDCYVRVYHMSLSDRSLTLVFPNRVETDAFLPAGTVRRIPGDSSGVTFEVSKPDGVDALYVLGSDQPFTDTPWIASILGGVASDPGPSETRGIRRVGDYVTEGGLTLERARNVMAKGLLVRLPEAAPPSRTPGSNQAAPYATNVPPQTSPSPADEPIRWNVPSPERAPALQTPTATPSDPALGGFRLDPASASARPELARAACFFTTLPPLRVR